jgi:hypothetical protein
MLLYEVLISLRNQQSSSIWSEVCRSRRSIRMVLGTGLLDIFVHKNIERYITCTGLYGHVTYQYRYGTQKNTTDVIIAKQE